MNKILDAGIIVMCDVYAHAPFQMSTMPAHRMSSATTSMMMVSFLIDGGTPLSGGLCYLVHAAAVDVRHQDAGDGKRDSALDVQHPA